MLAQFLQPVDSLDPMFDGRIPFLVHMFNVCPTVSFFLLFGSFRGYKRLDFTVGQMSGIACLGVSQTQVTTRRGSTRPSLSESGAIPVLGLILV